MNSVNELRIFKSEWEVYALYMYALVLPVNYTWLKTVIRTLSIQINNQFRQFPILASIHECVGKKVSTDNIIKGEGHSKKHIFLSSPIKSLY